MSFMELGIKRTVFARIAAGCGCLCGVMGLLAAITNDSSGLTPHGWGIGGILFLLLAVFVLLDGVVSLERYERMAGNVRRKHEIPS